MVNYRSNARKIVKISETFDFCTILSDIVFAVSDKMEKLKYFVKCSNTYFHAIEK